jgi:hypothetical protein
MRCSNAAHGLPRTDADKRKAVRLLLADAEWGQWSDRESARHCQVSQVFVSKLRKAASDNGYQMKPRKVKRGNTVYEMQARRRSSKQRVRRRSTWPCSLLDWQISSPCILKLATPRAFLHRTPADTELAPLANSSLSLLDLEGAVLSSAEFFANG